MKILTRTLSITKKKCLNVDIRSKCYIVSYISFHCLYKPNIAFKYFFKQYIHVYFCYVNKIYQNQFVLQTKRPRAN